MKCGFKVIFKNQILKSRILKEKILLETKVLIYLKSDNNSLYKKKSRLQYLYQNFEKVVFESYDYEIREIDRKKVVIDSLTNFIYGAQGEQKLVNELKKLTDGYILINDFCYSFYPQIYNKAQNFYVKSIQVDHLLISPSGIFIIETKNWSDNSLNNSSLFSPVKQIKRANFGIFTILSEFRNSKSILNKHYWGERKIPLRNIVVLINNRPIEDFKYAKLLTLNELNGYLKYFTPIFTNEEVEKIADYFIKQNMSI